MQTFKGVFALTVSDVYLQINDVIIKGTKYPVFEKGADLHQEHFLFEQ